MDRLTDEELLSTYMQALKLKLEDDFILLLLTELQRRQLSVA